MNITFTPLAINKLNDMRTHFHKSHCNIRLAVMGGGCSGYSYDMDFAEEDELTPLDTVLDYDSVKVYIDPMSAALLDGIEVDYVEELLNAGFKFLNPQATNTCGCGSSFSV